MFRAKHRDCQHCLGTLFVNDEDLFARPLRTLEMARIYASQAYRVGSLDGDSWIRIGECGGKEY